MASAVVYEFPKNKRETIRAQLGEFAGRPIASLWAFTRSSTGEMQPCKGKGLVLSQDCLPELEEAVKALRAGVGK